MRLAQRGREALAIRQAQVHHKVTTAAAVKQMAHIGRAVAAVVLVPLEAMV